MSGPITWLGANTMKRNAATLKLRGLDGQGVDALRKSQLYIVACSALVHLPLGWW